jgi:hypothetical protein
MEKLGTLESEVLSHEVVDGRVKVVVRTVPGMKLPRVVRPVLRGKEVEFVDTRTFLQRDKGKLPFAQTFRTVNNITERASVAGTIVIDRAPVPVLQNTEGAMMMGTVIRVQGECVVRIAGLGGKVESVIVQNLRNAYKKLPEIVHEWVATRETRLTEFGFAGGIPGGIQRSPSLSATSVETVVETTNAVTSPRLIRAASVESEGSDLSSASFHSADSFQIENESARDDGREEGWGGRGGDARSAGAASNGSSERYPQTPSFAASKKAAPASAPGRRERRGGDPRRFVAVAARVRERLAAGDARVFPRVTRRRFGRLSQPGARHGHAAICRRGRRGGTSTAKGTSTARTSGRVARSTDDRRASAAAARRTRQTTPVSEVDFRLTVATLSATDSPRGSNKAGARKAGP